MIATRVGHGVIELLQGDLVDQRLDALVTAANRELRGGGGVDGAIHRAAGPRLLDACRRLKGCPVGSAVRTGAFDLEAKGVRAIVHAVGPVWSGGKRSEDDLLASAYRRALELADEAGFGSIGFPSISTGAYGFPIDRAAALAIEAVVGFLLEPGHGLGRVVFVLFGASSFEAFAEALAAATGTGR
jgi:O-acetyl-ADP-ribose deacetylase (regulator of RNase III)